MVDTNEVESHLIDRYEIRRRLGKGAYGIVWKANERKTGRVIALKKIFDAFRNATDAQRTFREILFLQEFSDHQNIIKLLNVVAAKNDKDIYLVFEYMDTDLHAVIRKGGILQDAHQRYIMAQLLRATAYLHSGNVIHRDHKPSNILLDSDCLVKICDFGLARSLSQLPLAGKNKDFSVPALTEYVATRWYRAPEILLSSPHYTKGVDMWSLGCILAEMLLGKPLFPGDSTFDQIEKIIRVIPPPSKLDIETIGSQYAQTVIERAQRKAKKSIRDIMPSAAPTDGINLIQKLLVFNPEKRPAAESCLKHAYVARFNSKKDNLNLGYNVIPPINDDTQLTVDEYRQRLYAMIQERKMAQKEERMRKDLQNASGDHKDPNETLTDKNATLTEDNFDTHEVIKKEKRKERHTKSFQSTKNEKNDNFSRHKSAPMYRNTQTKDIVKDCEQHRVNANVMKHNEAKMGDLSVTGKVLSTQTGYKTRTQQNRQTLPSRPQRRPSGTHKNAPSAAITKKAMGASHTPTYAGLTAPWLREHS